MAHTKHFANVCWLQISVTGKINFYQSLKTLIKLSSTTYNKDSILSPLSFAISLSILYERTKVHLELTVTFN